MTYPTIDETTDALAYATQYFKLAFPVDTMFTATDGRAFAFYHPIDGFDLGIKPGDTIPPDDLQPQVMAEDRAIWAEMGPELFGKPYRCVVAPLHDSRTGKPAGTIEAGNTLTVQNEIREAVEVLAPAISEVVAVADRLLAAGTDVVTIRERLQETFQRAREQVQASAQILASINDITQQTAMLGLNARIEAARSGGSANNFTVVANEIRQLADRVAGAAKDVEATLNDLRSVFGRIEDAIDATGAVGQEQADLATSLSDRLAEAEKLQAVIIDVAGKI
jgi:uncharacterized protein YukE